MRFATVTQVMPVGSKQGETSLMSARDDLAPAQGAEDDLGVARRDAAVDLGHAGTGQEGGIEPVDASSEM